MSLNSSVAEELCSLKDPSKQSELADLIIRRHLSMRKGRELVNQCRDDDNDPDFTLDSITEHSQRTLDKLILVLRVALNNIGGLIIDSEEEWVLREVIMHHKNLVHEQIDLLIITNSAAAHLKFETTGTIVLGAFEQNLRTTQKVLSLQVILSVQALRQIEVTVALPARIIRVKFSSLKFFMLEADSDFFSFAVCQQQLAAADEPN
jgi:hypothetical protein